MLRVFFVSSVIGAHVASLIAGFNGNMYRCVGWAVVAGLWAIAAAIEGRRS